jgi:hypothetical protein
MPAYQHVLHTLHHALLRAKRKVSHTGRIIASLTSYPARIGSVHIAIRSILEQSLPPDKCILYLAESQFEGGMSDIPDSLLGLIDEYEGVLDIRFVDKDIRSHKKYAYAMREYPHDLIVLFDDDLIYDSDIIEELYFSYRRNRRLPAIYCVRAHRMAYDDGGNLSSYATWEKEVKGPCGIPTEDLFATTGAGSLIAPGTLSPEVLDTDAAFKLAPTADDVWINIHARRMGSFVVLVYPTRPLHYIEGTQQDGLWESVNSRVVDAGRRGDIERTDSTDSERPARTECLTANDVQIRDVLGAYGAGM